MIFTNIIFIKYYIPIMISTMTIKYCIPIMVLTIMHQLLYMDDLKLYVEINKYLKTPLETILFFATDICTKFRLDHGRANCLTCGPHRIVKLDSGPNREQMGGLLFKVIQTMCKTWISFSDIIWTGWAFLVEEFTGCSLSVPELSTSRVATFAAHTRPHQLEIEEPSKWVCFKQLQ